MKPINLKEAALVILTASVCLITLDYKDSVPVPTYRDGNGNGIQTKEKTVPSSAVVYTWGGIKGAQKYKVMFQKADTSKVAFQGYTKQMRIKVELNRGEYNWYVWPIVNGLEGKAIVASKLTVP